MKHIKPLFNEIKSTGLASYLLELAGGCLNYMHLIKLMYLVDRQSFCEIGQFVTNDDMYSLPNGPLLSNIDDLITEPSREKTVWQNHISAPSDYCVRLLDVDHSDVQNTLSDYEKELAQKVFEQYGKMDVWALVDYLHKVLPEWENPGKGRKPINLDIILSDCKKKPEEKEQIFDYLREQARAERFFI